MIDLCFIKPFLNKKIGIVYTESFGRDYFLKGILTRVSTNTVLISNSLHGDAIIAISAIKKIKEMRDSEC